VSTHPDLAPEAVEALRDSLGIGAPPTNGAGGETEASTGVHVTAPSARMPLKARLRAGVRNRVRAATAPVLDRLAGRLVERVRHSVRMDLRVEYGQFESELQMLRATVDAVVPVLDGLAELARAGESQRALVVNQELMKGELSAFHEALDQLGHAIAPTAGLEGVPARFAELRERVNATDRELRRLLASEHAVATGQPAAPVAAPGAPAAPAVAASAFDYVGFEQRFRGDPDAVLTELERRYGDLLAEHQPVVDIGCGRGELLAALAERGVRGIGVEPEVGMAAAARARGLEIHATGALEFLSEAEPGSFGAITAIHVAEHLDLDTLVAFLELAVTRLRPGGVLVLETPNPASLVVLGNSYVMDPTHVRPLHPALVAFMCERAGFRDVELRFHSPAESYQLPMLDEGADAPAWVQTVNRAFAKLNDSLYGPQEYAAIATTAPAPDATSD
jgi:2-polyprenyl-3-methyl-5-hydroxy-6-metoxy-1,4-benzoquinol methylase